MNTATLKAYSPKVRRDYIMDVGVTGKPPRSDYDH